MKKVLIIIVVIICVMCILFIFLMNNMKYYDLTSDTIIIKTTKLVNDSNEKIEIKISDKETIKKMKKYCKYGFFKKNNTYVRTNLANPIEIIFNDNFSLKIKNSIEYAETKDGQSVLLNSKFVDMIQNIIKQNMKEN